jgi:hypothetical protein
MTDPEEPLTISGRIWPSFLARTITLPPGLSVSYDESEWRDALVIVESGGLDLDGADGRSWHFRCGDVLWLVGLPVLALRNSGDEPVVLKAISRQGKTGDAG